MIKENKIMAVNIIPTFEGGIIKIRVINPKKSEIKAAIFNVFGLILFTFLI